MRLNENELASEERRNFLKLAASGSFTAALVAGAGGMLLQRIPVAIHGAENRGLVLALSQHVVSAVILFMDSEAQWLVFAVPQDTHTVGIIQEPASGLGFTVVAYLGEFTLG